MTAGDELIIDTDFYSRPCGRGDPVGFLRAFYVNRISTHAPAGGATFGAVCLRLIFVISTHAPAGGATPQPRPALACLSSNFYSRPCGRGDSLPP